MHVYARQKFVPIHAMTVKRAYGTQSTGHRKNKIKSVLRVQQMIPTLFQGVHGKIDDMSDAYLLAHFYTFHLHQHRKFLSNTPNDTENQNENNNDRPTVV